MRRQARATGSSRRSESRPGVVLAAAFAAVLALLAVLGTGPSELRRPHAGRGIRVELGDGLGTADFARAVERREYLLPLDHGPHFEYQTEWWYYTGHLRAGERRYGFQLTFFRRGLSPGAPPDEGGLATNQIYFAHFAITDVAAGKHLFAERWGRGAGGLAGAETAPFSVWLEDWRVEATNDDGGTVRLVARDGPLLLDLELETRKPLARHGDRGLSPKSPESGNASHYVGYTRLGACGQLAVDGHARPVSGEAWFDHEWSTSALGARAVGWDWFSLQLDDETELLFFQIRREDGSIEPVSSGTLVAGDGRTRRVSATAVSLTVLDRWTSPETGATYPALWRLRVPEEGLDLLVEPRIPNQEMRTSFVYWEGAVRVSGTRGGQPLRGQGYVELTGYERTMQGVF